MLRCGLFSVLVPPIFCQMVKVGPAKHTIKRGSAVCNYRHLVLAYRSLTKSDLNNHISQYHAKKEHFIKLLTCKELSCDSLGERVELHGKISSLNKGQCILSDNTGSVRLILGQNVNSKWMEILKSGLFVKITGVVQKNTNIKGDIESDRYNFVVLLDNVICISSMPSSFWSQPKESLNLGLLPEELSRISPSSMHYFFQRSDNCATLKKAKMRKDVTLCGWVHTVHDENSFTLKDNYGSVLVNYNGEVENLIPGAKGIAEDDLVFVKGVISFKSELLDHVSAKEVKVIEESVDDDTAGHSQGCSKNDAQKSNEENVYSVISGDENEEKKNISPDVNRYTLRSHNCGEINESLVGKTVHLMGWALYVRMNRFIVLMDKYGTVQLVISDSREDLQNLLKDLLPESVISVTGTVSSRPRGLENRFMKSGVFEVCVEDMQIISKSSPLPIHSKSKNPSKTVLFKYRYLDLRHNMILKNGLKMRSDLIHKMRKFLVENVGFLEVETPTLFRRTPGGAQEFIVPTRNKGEFYSLVQSPQQFKQLLMVGGIDRYFQIARCYRDEKGEKDRQPEFTQLDLEMSFCNREGVLNLIEDLIQYIWPHDIQRLVTPFPRLTYEEAMTKYGTDKPDTRFGCKITDLTDAFLSAGKQERSTVNINDYLDLSDFAAYIMVIPNALTIKTSLENAAKEKRMSKNLYICTIRANLKLYSIFRNMFSPSVATYINKVILCEPEDVIVIGLGSKSDVLKAIGDIRVVAANYFNNCKSGNIDRNDFHFTWILDFPLFELVDGQMKAVHHPFTQPHPDDAHLLYAEPLKVRSLHYDLVLNGSEIGGGSIRIHNAALQKNILENILKMDVTPLKHLLEALDSGAPSHGGFALGVDRFVASLCGLTYINDVIAFPKSSAGRDAMCGAPCAISDEEKVLYHIQ